MGRLPLVHALFAALVDHALGIAEDGVLVRQPHALRGGDDGGAVLVVVEDGDLHLLAKSVLDDEALGRLDVLEVDAAEARAQEAHAVDELVHVLGRDLEVDAVDVGEALEEDRLALHHRLRGERPQVAEAEHRGAVRDHRHQVALGGEVVGLARVLGDGETGGRHPRGVGERQVPLGGQRFGRRDLHLARPAPGVKKQGLPIEAGFVLVHRGAPVGRARGDRTTSVINALAARD
jgi:hypothetical protein